MNGSPSLILYICMFLGTTYALMVLFHFCFGWLQVLLGLAQGKPLIEFSPRNAVPWTILEILGVVIVYLLVSGLFVAALHFGMDSGDASLQSLQTVQDRQIAIGASTVATLLSASLMAVLLILSSHATLTDLGLGPKAFQQILPDLQLGFLVFSMLAPIVFGLQNLFVEVLDYRSAHPLIVQIEETKDPLLFLLVTIAAVITAPIAEEFVFRVILQGWLERLCLPKLAPEVEPTDGTTEFHPTGLPTQLPTPPQQLASPKLLENAIPILVSALIFALLHYSHGPDWVPLTVLALGLGYVYQRTHRILPVIFIHFLLNSHSIFGLAIKLFLVDPAAKP